MQIFELHFNPKSREDYFCNSFAFNPPSIYEKKLGSLYAVGELKNALPTNQRFIDNLSKTVKTKYYNFSWKTAEKGLSEGLKKANEFFQDEVKKENVSWLGNLNYALVCVKDYDLSFTKTGEIKILLVRGGQITDIGKNLDLEEIEPYPLKVFFHIVSGRLAPDDLILVFTKNIYDFFIKESILKTICQAGVLTEKKLRDIIPSQLISQKKFANLSGICFSISLSEKAQTDKEMIFRKKENFTIAELFAPIIKVQEFVLKKLAFFDFVKVEFFIIAKLAGKIFKKLASIKAWLPSRKAKSWKVPVKQKNTIKTHKIKVKIKTHKTKPGDLLILLKKWIKIPDVRFRVMVVGILTILLGLGYIIFK